MIRILICLTLLLCIALSGCSGDNKRERKHAVPVSQSLKINGDGIKKAKDSKYEIRGMVVRVKDGDTIILKTSKGEVHDVRLYGIDTPEKDQPYGPQATGCLKKLIADKNVNLKVYGIDRNKRLLAKVYYNNHDINAELIKIGAAWHYKFFDKSKDYDRYAYLETEAKDRRLGLWNKPNPVPPWEFRKAKKNKGK